MIIQHNLHYCVCSYFPHPVHQITMRVSFPTSGIRAGLWRSIDFLSIGSWFDDFLCKLLKIIGVLATWNQAFCSINCSWKLTVHLVLFLLSHSILSSYFWLDRIICLLSMELFLLFSSINSILLCSWAQLVSFTIHSWVQ